MALSNVNDGYADTPLSGSGESSGEIEKRKMDEVIRRNERLESLGLLAGGIAHDFNNLLAGVFSYIGLAREYGKDNPNVRECLDKALQVHGQAKALTQQLLTFSHGGAPVKLLTPIADLLCDHISFALSGTNVKPEFFLPVDLWQCDVDAGQLGDVIHNIVLNAQQAMPEGGTLRIVAENIDMKEQSQSLTVGKFVRIAIRDSGSGISAQHIGKVFDPFFSTKQKGSGLGLSIAYSVVRKHGGHIEIESEVGRGTEVRIFLPASITSFVQPAPLSGLSARTGAKVLLMDDEEFLLDAIGSVIRSFGYSVETALDGKSAIDKYKTALSSGSRFDAIILDLTIPGGMGGKQVMREIRCIDSKVCAIATSGYSDDPVIAEPGRFGLGVRS